MESDVVCSCVEQRCIIEFLVNKKLKPAEILRRLNAQYGWETLSCTSVCDWYIKFPEGRKEVETHLPAGKIMEIILWASEGVILVDFLPNGVTINTQYYDSSLCSNMQHIIWKKRPGKCKRKSSYCMTTLAHIRKILWRWHWQQWAGNSQTTPLTALT
jgi:hypothetical protein